MNEKLKVLVVDGTVFYRKVLSMLVEEIPGTGLIGAASNGKTALKKIELTPPDLLLLDVAMPDMDGLEALGVIKANYPDVEVIMVSGADMETASMTVKSLEAGALDFITKPRTSTFDMAIKELRSGLVPLIALVKTHKHAREAGRKNPLPSGSDKPVIIVPEANGKSKVTGAYIPDIRKKREIGKIHVVAIGGSTGGPNTLKQIIPNLSGDFPVPILAVQHMPPMFTASLANNLDKISSIRVVEGKAGQPVEKGVMYIAPGGYHMVVQKNGSGEINLGIVDTPPVHNCRPAVDTLFRSIGEVYGGNVLTVILTGMGSDGVNGVSSIRSKGGYSLVQDEKSSVVWGMPGAVVQAGEADEIHGGDKIAGRIMEIVMKGRL